MAVYVPDNELFSLNDVYNAVKDHDSSVDGDLSDCFAKSESSYFDPNYNTISYAPENSMLRFRNYGPKGTPTPGTFVIPSPFYTKTYGMHIYVSPNGSNLYISVIHGLNTTNQTIMLLRYTMNNFDLSTLQYHSQLILPNEDESNNVYTYGAIRFSPDGTALSIASHISYGGDALTNNKIHTYVLDTPWDITSVSYNYITILSPYSTNNTLSTICGIMHYDFTENGYYLVVLSYKSGSYSRAFFYPLSSPSNIPYTIPSGTLFWSDSTLIGDSSFINTVLGFRVFDNSYNPGIIEIVMNAVDSNNFSALTVQLDKNPWNAYGYPFITDYVQQEPFHIISTYTTPQRQYTFCLEDVYPSSQLFPRVYMRIN